MSKFKVGDKVCSSFEPYKGEFIYQGRSYLSGNYALNYALVIDGTGQEFQFAYDDLTLVESSIQRPVLEERKVGKVRMELFDSGFPNAVYEIAKVMTWANENKGYKDNDWKTIPDAENAFKGAAARHRVKQNMQRSFGEDLLNCADEESNITHLAHEAFNVLALLELALVGKIK